ncbi:MBOAT family O-acyltransferase [Erythrobacter sp. NE805]|uniref:MBOAT family O-acyltransferase n=1 Tax=Erythrobacter sp. NE805 TaxID=3389875 RepID=UPI00396B3F28
MAVYYGLALSRLAPMRRPFLIAATIFFYAFAGLQFVLLLLASTVLNFVAGLMVGRLAEHQKRRGLVMAGAVVLNLLVLGYFKYFAFLVETVGALTGNGFRVEGIVLPLGISFFTFQQIGYLVDVNRGKIKPASLLDYATFVLFFPQLLAGPIVFYDEVEGQHRTPPTRGRVGANILVGLAIFGIGLFKKTVIADTLALYSMPVFGAAEDGGTLGLVDTWIAAFAYTAQVYFDFSGYSDMAIGTARMLGIVLPLNFLSPLRSRSVSEIWRRWHVTLGRWVQLYVFQPISIPLARAAAMRGMGTYGTLVLSMILPTMIAMLIIGVWHGAGWTFVVFGLMQGAYMSIGEFWATFRRKARKARRKAGVAEPAWSAPLARAATLFAFVAAILPFGAASGAAMLSLFAAAFGAGAGGLIHVPADWPLGLGAALASTFAAYVIIYVLPNSQEIMTRFDPVLNWRDDWAKRAPSPVQFAWRMTGRWALATGLTLFLAVAFIMRGTTKFIYFNF